MEEGIVAMLNHFSERVRQFICGLHGHDALLHFGQGRLSLQCTSCGHETPGWDLKAGQLPIELRDAARLTLPLAQERRVA